MYKLYCLLILIFLSGSINARKNLFSDSKIIKSDNSEEVVLNNYAIIDSLVVYTENGISHENYILQYWDDANWTDIDDTIMSIDNDRVCYKLKSRITSFRFRVLSIHKQLGLIDFQGYGTILEKILISGNDKITSGSFQSDVEAVVYPEIVGHTMKYVGYNQGYFLPKTNVTSWIDYSNINSMRIWASLDSYVSRKMVDTSVTVNSKDEFEKMKNQVRINPEKSPLIFWEEIDKRANTEDLSNNSMIYSYVLKELKKRNIDVILQSSSKTRVPDWDTKWIQWLRMYAFVYYSAKNGAVEMYAMQNEPNHRDSGPIPLDEWIEMMRISSDAVHCAVEDVNRDYSTNLRGKFVGPVTAGTNTNWWTAISETERIDYKGEPMNRDNIDIFSTHSYNSAANGYIGRVSMIDSILVNSHPIKQRKPIVFTEIGRWMNAYLIDKEETMDSPSLFTEWAGIYAQNMRENCYGMWAFKFANTSTNVFKQGVKSGHHHIWKGKRFAEDSFNSIIKDAKVSASSCIEGHQSENVIDGKKVYSRSWIAESNEEKELYIELPETRTMGGLVLYSGSEGGEFTAPDRIRSFDISVRTVSGWKTIAIEKKNYFAQYFLRLDSPEKISALRINIKDKGKCIIRELKVFDESFISDYEICYDVSGVQRTAEVVRLFAKGFKDELPLYRVENRNYNRSVDICASIDSVNKRMYMWVVKRNSPSGRLHLDLSHIIGRTRRFVIAEMVSDMYFGEAIPYMTDLNGCLDIEFPKYSVSLLTISLSDDEEKKIMSSGVRGISPEKISSESIISMDGVNKDKNNVVQIEFKLKKTSKVKCALLAVCGKSNVDKFRFHVYSSDDCMKNTVWDSFSFYDDCTGIKNHDEHFKVAGQMVMNKNGEWHYLDVTSLVNYYDKNILFTLIRELREPGDDMDNGNYAYINGNNIKVKPYLLIWE